MMYDTLLARSFSKHEQKRFGYGALLASLFVAVSFCTVFKPYLDPFPSLSLRLSIGVDQKLQILNDTPSSLPVAKEIITNGTSISHDASTSREVVRESIETQKSKVFSDVGRSHQIDKELMAKTTGLTNHSRSSQQRAQDEGATSKNTTMPADARSPSKTPTKDEDVIKMKQNQPECSFLRRSEFCEVNGYVRIEGKSSTVSIVISEQDFLTAENASWSIKPYARKGDQTAMSSISEWTVKLATDHADIAQCSKNHRVPAILFSLGGYSGNHFHAFTDIIVPLFATARPFKGEVQFLITDKDPRWIPKFQTLVKALSRYDIIDIDRSEHIHCFPSVTVGLKARPDHKELSIDPLKSSYSMKDFREFLRSSYSLKKTAAIKIKNGDRKKPRLLIISRKRSRAFTNVGEIARMARRLGYKVVIGEADADVSRFAQIMNSCDVVMGVHGAGLTNMVFLPENAILIQVVPFGGAEWVSRTYFEEPAKGMGIRYVEYKIGVEESTLIEQYPSNHVVLRDPSVIQRQGWEVFKSTYLDKQNVKLDVNRFRPSLLKALELLRQ